MLPGDHALLRYPWPGASHMSVLHAVSVARFSLGLRRRHQMLACPLLPMPSSVKQHLLAPGHESGQGNECRGGLCF